MQETFSEIGKSGKCFIIAEIGTSHGGDLKKAFALIDAASTTGCDCIKFQFVLADEIIHPLTGEVSLPGGKINLYTVFKKQERTTDFYQKLKEYTEKKGLTFLCTPFGLKSARYLKDMQVKAFKIASPELNHIPLLKEINSYKLPVILSTGVSTLSDIEAALELIDSQVYLLHCITQYPAPEEEYNLKVIPLLASIFGLYTGISDHSKHPVLVPVLAVSQGACILEKHFTLSSGGTGLDDPIALEPAAFTLMTASVREAERMGSTAAINAMMHEYGKAKVLSILGTGKKTLAPSEKMNYPTTNRSIHALYNIAAGDMLSPENIALLRSEKNLTPGLHPRYYALILGKRIITSLKAGEGLNWEHLF